MRISQQFYDGEKGSKGPCPQGTFSVWAVCEAWPLTGASAQGDYTSFLQCVFVTCPPLVTPLGSGIRRILLILLWRRHPELTQLCKGLGS